MELELIHVYFYPYAHPSYLETYCSHREKLAFTLARNEMKWLKRGSLLRVLLGTHPLERGDIHKLSILFFVGCMACLSILTQLLVFEDINRNLQKITALEMPQIEFDIELLIYILQETSSM